MISLGEVRSLSSSVLKEVKNKEASRMLCELPSYCIYKRIASLFPLTSREENRKEGKMEKITLEFLAVL